MSATTPSQLASIAVLAAIIAAVPARAQTIEDKAQLCAACHGENGIPQQKTTPVIWGQHQGYTYLQLRDYKSGSRNNEIRSEERRVGKECRTRGTACQEK